MKNKENNTKYYFVKYAPNSGDQTLGQNGNTTGKSSKWLIWEDPLARISTETLKLNMVKMGDGEESTDFISNIEQLMAYQFPTDGQDNTSHKEICNEMHELVEDDPEFSQKELYAVFRSTN